MRISFLIVLMLVLCQYAQAASDDLFPRGYVCYKTSEKIKVDGKLDDTAWQKVPWTDDFVDISKPVKTKIPYQTHSKMLWDDKYLYIGIYLEEPYVWGTLTKHDSVIYMENCAEVFIDPDGDNHNYYEIEINPLNTTWDLYMSRPYRDDGWNDGKFELKGMKNAVYVDGKLNSFNQKDKGWSVEFAIPWTALKVYANSSTPPNEGDQWRMNFLRIQWPITLNPKKSEKVPNLPIGRPQKPSTAFASWNSLGAVDAHKPEMWGFVQFTSGKAGTVEFKRDPDYSIRTELMRLYFAEKRFNRRYQNWTASLTELGFKPNTAFSDSLKIELTDDGFKASIDSKSKPGMKLNILQNSKIWMDTK